MILICGFAFVVLGLLFVFGLWYDVCYLRLVDILNWLLWFCSLLMVFGCWLFLLWLIFVIVFLVVLCLIVFVCFVFLMLRFLLFIGLIDFGGLLVAAFL